MMLGKLFGKKKMSSKPIKNYHYDQALSVNKLIPLKGKSVLIVGCSTGVDCKIFVELGVDRIVGIDVDDRIGNDFQHAKIQYLKISAENMKGIESDQFDLVYALATLEHIPDIGAALGEMVRVCRPQGYIYAFSAPLWCSSYGHHKANIFSGHPWIHLLFSENEILTYCYEQKIEDKDGKHSIEDHVHYMLDSKHFNKLKSSFYLNAANSLQRIELIKNILYFDKEETLSYEIFQKLSQKGYTKEDLLARSHYLVAKKE